MYDSPAKCHGDNADLVQHEWIVASESSGLLQKTGGQITTVTSTARIDLTGVQQRHVASKREREQIEVCDVIDKKCACVCLLGTGLVCSKVGGQCLVEFSIGSK